MSDDIEVTCEMVHTLNRHDIPESNETILTDFEDAPFHIFTSVTIYFRDENDCPFGRGNWIADIKFKDSKKTFCIKLPKEMKESEVQRYFLPLTDFLKTKMV